MGTLYVGACAEHVGDGHAGYAARRCSDGSLTATRTAATAGFTAYVAACECGWHGSIEHPPTDDGEIAAAGEWNRSHLRPLIEAARTDWPRWADRVADRARAVAAHIGSDRADLAAEVAGRLEVEVAMWRRTAQELAEGGV
ncbi:hypothetical protein [Actinopolymorpha pittospori]|uniref:Uncharacterized protein n=1 Tax=Actinopolymorpha pittospori TaxID=648752 RepID=A0A927R996_9ACTN|nr:hypothetical protein [Actinopolymorpha pittospori]MBE1603765.1 hypothetical protein [Actinopolymorpha pittospori]